MSQNDSSELDRDTRLERILADYLHSVAAGTALDRDALISANPELADELRSFFRNRDAVRRVAGPLAGQLPADTATIGMDTALAVDGTRIRYFGDYELLAEIARGGMGVVYKARQVSLNRPVALKMILSAQLASADEVARFHAEAEAVANLDHPNVTPIYEIGEHEGQRYFSMKLIEGPNLREALPELRGDIHRGVLLLSKVARAIHHAHLRGVLHRDLKPSNILIDATGEPYVTDFGLAKRFEGNSELTRTGAVVGTPSYMAPEQATADSSGIGPAVDIYGLGSILYEMLTGRPPFRAESIAVTLSLVSTQPPVPPRFLSNSVPRDLEAVCLKCLEKNPTNRYATADELAEELDRFLQGARVLARRRIGVVSNQRRPALIAAIVGLICGVGISLFAGAEGMEAVAPGIFGAVLAPLVCMASICIWNELLLPAWLLSRTSHPLAKTAFGLGLVLVSIFSFGSMQFFQARGTGVEGEKILAGLVIASMLAGIVGKVLCLAATYQGPVQGPLLLAITADLVAFTFRINRSPVEVETNTVGVTFSGDFAAPLFYLGAIFFVLAIKRMAHGFDEPLLEKTARRLLYWMVVYYPLLMVAILLCALNFPETILVLVAVAALGTVYGMIKYAQLTYGLQNRVLQRF